MTNAPAPPLDALNAAKSLISADPAAATTAFAALCAAHPRSAAPLIGLAAAQGALGNDEACGQLLDLALKLEPNNLLALNNLAILRRQTHDLDAALALLQRADAIAPFDPLIGANMISILRLMLRNDAAIAYATAWVGARPKEAAAWEAYCECMIARRQGAAAIAGARRLAALRPDAKSYALLAKALDAHAEYAAGLRVAQDAVARWPRDPHARTAQAHLLTSMGRAEEALAELAILRQLDPKEDRRGLESRAGLMAGPTLAAWRAYEHRFETTHLRAPHMGKPIWTGGDVAGKRVVLVDEQGFGDKIQFSRAAWEIVARGGEAILYFVPQLAPLFTHLPKGIRFASSVTGDEFDLCVSLMSAPLALGDPWAGPNTPYIRAPADRAPPEPLRAPRRAMRIGLAWAGSVLHDQDKLRSCGLGALIPLMGIPDTEYFSLQLGAPSEEIKTLRADPLVTDLSPHLGDWGDTAAAIAQLDLVITVDTAVAHLAGAMGKPVWTLVQFAPDWRWGASGSTTRWYPSMRLYRQTQPKCWRAPVAAMIRDLENELERGRRPAAAA